MQLDAWILNKASELAIAQKMTINSDLVSTIHVLIPPMPLVMSRAAELEYIRLGAEKIANSFDAVKGLLAQDGRALTDVDKL